MDSFDDFLINDLGFEKKDHFYFHVVKRLAVCFLKIDSNLNQNMNSWQKLELPDFRKIAVLENDWTSKTQIVKSRILANFGQFTIIHGRNTIVKRIDKAEAETFLNTNHLQGSVSAKVKLGLFVKKTEQLVAVATFSGARMLNKNIAPQKSIELIRFANLLNTRVYGGLDKMLQYVFKNIEVADIMTYVDNSWGGGASLTKIGFEAELPMKQLNKYFDINTKKQIEIETEINNCIKIDWFDTIKYRLKCHKNQN